ncbi:hypothetical protein [Pseudomonas ovata]|nr:hypothetical protein [Pseudomonas ovata]
MIVHGAQVYPGASLPVHFVSAVCQAIESALPPDEKRPITLFFCHQAEY